jgi:hypothetical protein
MTPSSPCAFSTNNMMVYAMVTKAKKRLALSSDPKIKSPWRARGEAFHSAIRRKART